MFSLVVLEALLEFQVKVHSQKTLGTTRYGLSAKRRVKTTQRANTLLTPSNVVSKRPRAGRTSDCCL